jgi:hypothetical protein
VFDFALGETRLVPFDPSLTKDSGFLGLSEQECEACEGQGYYFPAYPDHPDWLAADDLKDRLDSSFRKGNKSARA